MDRLLHTHLRTNRKRDINVRLLRNWFRLPIFALLFCSTNLAAQPWFLGAKHPEAKGRTLPHGTLTDLTIHNGLVYAGYGEELNPPVTIRGYDAATDSWTIDVSTAELDPAEAEWLFDGAKEMNGFFWIPFNDPTNDGWTQVGEDYVWRSATALPTDPWELSTSVTDSTPGAGANSADPNHLFEFELFQGSIYLAGSSKDKKCRIWKTTNNGVTWSVATALAIGSDWTRCYFLKEFDGKLWTQKYNHGTFKVAAYAKVSSNGSNWSNASISPVFPNTSNEGGRPTYFKNSPANGGEEFLLLQHRFSYADVSHHGVLRGCSPTLCKNISPSRTIGSAGTTNRNIWDYQEHGGYIYVLHQNGEILKTDKISVVPKPDWELVATVAGSPRSLALDTVNSNTRIYVGKRGARIVWADF